MSLITRGSIEAADWVINFTLKPSAEGYHGGMFASALALDEIIKDKIESLLSKYDHFRLIFTVSTFDWLATCVSE